MCVPRFYARLTWKCIKIRSNKINFIGHRHSHKQSNNQGNRRFPGRAVWSGGVWHVAQGHLKVKGMSRHLPFYFPTLQLPAQTPPVSLCCLESTLSHNSISPKCTVCQIWKIWSRYITVTNILVNLLPHLHKQKQNLIQTDRTKRVPRESHDFILPINEVYWSLFSTHNLCGTGVIILHFRHKTPALPALNLLQTRMQSCSLVVLHTSLLLL